MSEERLKEIQRRETQATWTADLLRDDADTIADYCLSPNEEYRLPASHCWACRIAETLDKLADSRDDVPDLLAEVSRLRADGATLLHRAEQAETISSDAKAEIDRLVVRCGEFSEAHAASFKALHTLSAALFDGEVDDYGALAEKIIARVRQAESDGATLRERVRKLPSPWLATTRTVGFKRTGNFSREWSGSCAWCNVRVTTDIGASQPSHPDNGCLWSDVHKDAK